MTLLAEDRQVTDLLTPWTAVRLQSVANRFRRGVEIFGLNATPLSSSHDAMSVDTTPRDIVSLWTPGTSYGRVTDAGRRSFADSLQRIQERTQLDWGQIARTLGVSRRTVHNWLSGSRVNGINAERIAHLYRAVIQELQNVSLEDSRAFLLAADANGQTPLARITIALRAASPQLRPTLRPVDGLRSSASPDGPAITAGLYDGAEVVEVDTGPASES